MKRLSLALLAFAMALMNIEYAMADSLVVNGSDSGWGAVGSLDGSQSSSDVFSITRGNEIEINGHFAMVAPSAASSGTVYNEWVVYKERLNPSVFPVATNDGLLFLLASGDGANIWSIGDRIFFDTYDSKTRQWLNYGISGYGGSARITPTPEPGSLILLGAGLLGLALVLFRRPKPPSHRPVNQG